MENVLSLLLIEDNELDAELIIRQLKKSEYNINFLRIETGVQMTDALKNSAWDIVICDYHLPAFDSFSALKILQEFDKTIPFIVISGNIGEESAIELMRAGAHDYLLKDNLVRLLPVIRRELEETKIRRAHSLAEKKLVENEEFFRATFENTTVGVALVSLEGDIFHLNDTFAKILGYTQEELLNTNFNDVTHKDDWSVGESYLKRMVAGEIDKAGFEKRYIRKDGSIIWVLVSTVIIRNPKNESPYILTNILDITERKNTESELVKAKEKAEEADVLKSSLMMNMSHEVRTPMNAILGFSSLILEESTESHIRMMADRIYESSERLMKTLDDILELTQLESGIQLKRLVKVDIESALNRIISEFEKHANQRHIKLKLHVRKNVQVVIEHDLFEKCISEIINNAIKFTETGKVDVYLNFKGTGETGKLEICIRDTGIGISKENLEIIFESFKQVSAGYGRNYEGIGIGLTIAKKCAELLNGEIKVNSTLGSGSEFIVIIPVDLNTVVPETADTQIFQNILPGQNERHPHPTCLLVEDNEDNAYITRSYLADIIEMDHALNMNDAIKICQNHKYSFILLDINLGAGMDGLDVVAKVRKMPFYDSIPIVALTGYTVNIDKLKFFNSGCTHYLGKPFTKEQLLELVKSII